MKKTIENIKTLRPEDLAICIGFLIKTRSGVLKSSTDSRLGVFEDYNECARRAILTGGDSIVKVYLSSVDPRSLQQACLDIVNRFDGERAALLELLRSVEDACSDVIDWDGDDGGVMVEIQLSRRSIHEIRAAIASAREGQ